MTVEQAINTTLNACCSVGASVAETRQALSELGLDAYRIQGIIADTGLSAPVVGEGANNREGDSNEYP